MPDWITHALTSWITGKVIKTEIALIVIGSLIPDLRYINLIFLKLLGINFHSYLDNIHTPVVAFLIGGTFALFFKDSKKAFLPIGIGIITHFILDFFLIHVLGGMRLLFPFSWDGWQFYLIRAEDYRMTIFAVFFAIIAYIIYYYFAKRQLKKSI